MIGHADRRGEGVTVRLRGGLGNQLFQYAAGTAVAARLACPLLVETGDLGAVLPGDTPRAFELDWIVEPDHVLTGATLGRSLRLLRRVARKAPFAMGPKTFTEASFAYDDRIDAVQPGTTLDGYFQSWRYFEAIEGPLRTSLLEAIPRSPWGTGIEEKLSAGGPWIAVHVRRGDYLKPHNSAYHGLLGQSYYRAALAHLTRRGLDHRIVVFSDEPDAARDLLGSRTSRVDVVRPPADSNPAESILLMSRAQAVVTANSSFSWWAAWIADPASSTVVCPVPWLSHAATDESDLRPPGWVSIDAGFTSG